MYRSSLNISAASWLSKIQKRQGILLSNSIATAAASKEEKKVDKKGGAEKKKKHEGAGADSSAKARSESLERFMVTAEKAKSLKIDFSPEELAKHFEIGREYNRQCMKRENAWNKDLTTKIYLQQDALAAMPANLREQALIIDETPAPDERDLPIYDTPPIKGFNPKLYNQNTSKKAKKRDDSGAGDDDDDEDEDDNDDSDDEDDDEDEK